MSKKHKSSKKIEKSKQKEKNNDDDDWVEAPISSSIPTKAVNQMKASKSPIVDEFSMMFDSSIGRTKKINTSISDNLTIAKSREINSSIYSSEQSIYNTEHYENQFQEPSNAEIEGFVSESPVTNDSSSMFTSNSKLVESSDPKERILTIADEQQKRPPSSLNQLNMLHAALLKAEIQDDKEIVKELKLKIKECGNSMEDDHDRIIMRESISGQWHPYQDKRGNDLKPNIYESINEMIQEEKFVSVKEMNAPLLKMTQKTFSAMGDYDMLDSRFTKGGASKRKFASHGDQERNRAIQETKKHSYTIENCEYCIASKNFQNHLVFSSWDYALLLVPKSKCLMDEEFYIVPTTHYSATTYCDEEVVNFINKLKQQIYSLFMKTNKCPLFIETFYDKNNRNHMLIDVIPINHQMVDETKMYFKKSLTESDQEWSDHKKLIEVKKNKLSQTIPRGFTYFSVEFGMDGGFAHVIEDKRRFQKYFAYEIIGGMLDLDATIWLKPKQETTENIMKRTLHLKQLFNKNITLE